MSVMVLDIALLFAFGAALCYAFADVIARFGLQRANPLIGSMIALVSSVSFFAFLIVGTGATFPHLGRHYLWVAAGGACNPGLFFVLYFIGIGKIGVSRAAPIKGSSPLFASLLAIAFLAERPTWYHLAGVLLVVAGIGLISSGSTGGNWRRTDTLWPLAAAIASGFAAIFWRMGIQSFSDTIAGTAVGVSVGLLVVAGYTVVSMGDKIAVNVRQGWKHFLLFGIIEGCGKLFYANALKFGEVFRVMPLIQTSPLFVVILALVVLRSVENISWRVPAGAIISVVGAILVNLSRELSF